MKIFKISDNTLLAQDVRKYNKIVDDCLCDELYVNTNVSIDEKNIKVIKLEFVLKKSYFKIPLVTIKYNYSNQSIINIDCRLCNTNHKSKNSNYCYHAFYLLQKYNENCIEGSLSFEEIEEKIKIALLEKQEIEKEKNRLKGLKQLHLLEKKLGLFDDFGVVQKASILPNFETVTEDGIYYVTEVDIKMGVDRLFIIKDLKEFFDNINEVETIQYGKNFTFTHSKNNFDARAKQFIDIIINYSFGTRWERSRTKKISPKATQTIIESYKGSNVMVGGEKYYVSLDSFEPKLYVEGNKLLLEGLDNIKLVIGNEYDFIAYDNEVYKLICDEELRYLVRFIINNKGFNSEYIVDEFIEKIIFRFIDKIELSEEFKIKYNISDLKIETYFDYNGNIVMKTKYFLNNIEVKESEVKNDVTVINKYKKYKAIITSLGFKNNELDTLDEVGDFLTADLSLLKEYSDIYLSDNINKLKVKKIPTAQTRISYNSGMLSCLVEKLNFNASELEKILDGIKKEVKYIKLKNDVIVKNEGETGKQLLNLIEEFSLDPSKLDETQEIPLYQGLKLLNDTSMFGDIEIDDTIRQMINDISKYKELNYELPIEVKDVLREYQIHAFNWLKTLTNYRFCGILADDMGLGKTLEIITLVLSDEDVQPSLIVCPKSLTYNWNKEFNKWASRINVKIINGTADDREKIIKSINNYDKTIYVTSYESLRNDLEFYEDKKFRFCILDEAQFIKNHTTLKAKSVKLINSEVRFVLTGTPIENNVVDLWSLFDFLMPNYLYSYKKFHSEFEYAITENLSGDAIKLLVQKITPFILRRTKKDVLKDLPEKIESTRYSQLYEEQRKIYEAELYKIQELLKVDKKISKLKILSTLTRLRQICVHPSMYIENYKGGSCKIDLVIELLEDYIKEGHKVLIFSQFTKVFPIIEKKLEEKGIKYFELTGQTSAEDRLEMTELFNDHSNPKKVFLISLKAGGTGLNLVGADIVIQLDPWWNIAAENQAADRVHRIGQKNIVQVIKLICEDTIEEKVLTLQNLKKDVVNALISDSDNNITWLSSDDLEFLLS